MYEFVRVLLMGFAALACSAAPARGEEAAATRTVIEPGLVHLRGGGGPREWSSFPDEAEAGVLVRPFQAGGNEATLRLRQQDVKQTWRVVLNDKPVGPLTRDESDQVTYLSLPAGALRAGENELRIELPAARGTLPDDIRVGEIWLDARPRDAALSQAQVQVRVVDAERGEALPARLTIVNEHGALHPVAIPPRDSLAVRSGVIYTADGTASFALPAGKYTLYAGRGLEYSLDKSELTLAAGQTAERTLSIRREVPTAGYVASDTHLHTFTHSRHGDASLTERLITLAGEAIELPIATDHNVAIDYGAEARRVGVRPYFTPVRGIEVTTSLGHFNVFPVAAGTRLPDFRKKSWEAIFDEIDGTSGVRAAILNHARDLHSDTRPFGPKRFNAVVGENLDGWPLRFTAMEVINSGATQTDPLRLVRDWMALLNRGYRITPVGSSDSHDVTRYIAGQGRTYIRADDRDPGALDVTAAIDAFLAGRVLVSYGLIVEAEVAGKYGSGDFAHLVGDELEIELRVLAPHWSRAERVLLFGNGVLLREERLPEAGLERSGLPRGVPWHETWRLPRPAHDMHLVAVALGPGISAPYWLTAKPYQPTSPEWQPYVMAVSGALWVDGDGDGLQTPAHGYAQRLLAETRGDVQKMIAALGTYDEATAAQAARLLHRAGLSPTADELMQELAGARASVRNGFAAYREAWRENERARAAQ